MKNQHDYIDDITEIRRMMVRSSKFLSLSGWAGILAGIFALSGAWFAHSVLKFQPDGFLYSHPNIETVSLTAAIILFFSLAAAFFVAGGRCYFFNTVDKLQHKVFAGPDSGLADFTGRLNRSVSKLFCNVLSIAADIPDTR